MNFKQVISHRNLPRRAPVSFTLLAATSCKAFDAPEWAWGAVGLLVLLLWIVYIAKVALEKEIEVNLFREKQEDKMNGEVKMDLGSKWQDRMNERHNQIRKNGGAI